MNKFQKFMRKYLISIILAVIAVAVMFGIYGIAHSLATAERGYEAVGGELFVFVIPFYIYSIRKTAKEMRG